MKKDDLIRFQGKASTSIPGVRRDNPATMIFKPQNVKMLAEGSPFHGKYTPDTTKAFVEFEICHSVPVVLGPDMNGGFCCFHPAALSRSHTGLRFQQTNLHHMIKAYDPENVSHDRIIGAVVDTWYPSEPQGGWKMPSAKADAVPIRVLASVFKQADGAVDMLEKHINGQEEWSVSIEATVRDLSDIGIYIPCDNKIVPILEADDELLSKVTRNDAGRYEFGRDREGNQMAPALGSVDGQCIFEGVGFTPHPAEETAEILGIRMSLRGRVADFDLQYAHALRKNWPSIWSMAKTRPEGANISSDTAFSTWALMKEGRKGKSIDDFLEVRSDIAASLAAGTDIRSVVTQIKWGLVGVLGVAGMKSVIDREKVARKR